MDPASIISLSQSWTRSENGSTRGPKGRICSLPLPPFSLFSPEDGSLNQLPKQCSLLFYNLKGCKKSKGTIFRIIINGILKNHISSQKRPLN
jgi:hypothetical protein